MRRTRRKKTKSSEPSNTVKNFEAMIMLSLLPDPVKEHEFSEEAKYRFDYAWPDMKVAVEIEGGIHNYGRHVRPEGYTNDCNKYNLAQIEGWIVLRYTSLNLERCINEIERAYFSRLQSEIPELEEFINF